MNKLILLAGMLCMPLRHLSLSSPYGYRVHPITGRYAFHAGVDLRARHDTVFAVLDAVVSTVGYDHLLGLFIRLDHGEFETSYGHLSQVFVTGTDSVSAGEPLGITGVSGRVTGEHLHFSVQFHNRYIDPLSFLLKIQNNLINKNKETKP